MVNLKEFPVTRYQGSKRKIIPWINEVLNELELEYESVLDGFGGTGTVSYLFKKLGKKVTYNDNLKFNYLIGKALIENNRITLTEEEISDLLKYRGQNQIVQNNFKGIYYLDKENRWIDNVVSGIEYLFNGDCESSLFKKSICYYALIQACLIKRPFNLFHRKNLYLRTNEVDRNFGNKTTWEQGFPELFKRFIKEANVAVFDNRKQCLSANESIFNVDETQFELVYLDPPYFSKKKNETSDYHKCYHFLEGLVNYSDWEKNINHESINKRLKATRQYEICEANVHEKFEELILKFKKSIIVLSYKRGGTPSIEFLYGLMKKIKGKAISRSIHYKYALNHQNGDAKKNREVLIIG